MSAVDPNPPQAIKDTGLPFCENHIQYLLVLLDEIKKDAADLPEKDDYIQKTFYQEAQALAYPIPGYARFLVIEGGQQDGSTAETDAERYTGTS
tara:strand:+ start:1204 stop:1485 length:282 start_codon:yes stop_codon:yes gene_type:complete